MKDELKVKVSKYVSYLLRHNPEDLKMDTQGFVRFDDLLNKVRSRFRVSREFIVEIVEKRARKRFEIVEDKIRALYGHTMPAEPELEEERAVKVLYHGTTRKAESKILKVGLKRMYRRWVHLSSTIEMARRVGLRRTNEPIILAIDVEAARRDGARFYRATEDVYLCRFIKSEHIRPALQV